MLERLFTWLWLNFPLSLLLTRFVVVLVAFTVHELAHGLVAALLGDPTAREEGRISLNPFKHQEYIGLIGGVLVGYGWSRPTPVRPHRMWLPGWLGGSLAVLAGPLANLAMVIVGQAALDTLGYAPDFAWAGWPTVPEVLTTWITFNLMLGLLNLLPLFPLDGYAFIRFLLPLRLVVWWERASGWTTVPLGFAMGVLLLMPPFVYTRYIIPRTYQVLQVLLGW
jgi:Zn-dependent protease